MSFEIDVNYDENANIYNKMCKSLGENRVQEKRSKVENSTSETKKYLSSLE